MEIFSIAKIGEVQFVRSQRAKRLRITIRPFKGIRVSVPFHVSLSEAKSFLESKQDWILQKSVVIKVREEEISEAQRNREEIDIDAACKYLYDRLHVLAEKFSYKFNRITFRNQKTRWGSCSAKNNLSLNIKLFKLPRNLQDYVLLHELVHTREKNHAAGFWREMEKLMPEAKKLDKELKNYTLMAL